MRVAMAFERIIPLLYATSNENVLLVVGHDTCHAIWICDLCFVVPKRIEICMKHTKAMWLWWPSIAVLMKMAKSKFACHTDAIFATNFVSTIADDGHALAIFTGLLYTTFRAYSLPQSHFMPDTFSTMCDSVDSPFCRIQCWSSPMMLLLLPCRPKTRKQV